jgi:uncharacterized phage protein gp47/JayE
VPVTSTGYVITSASARVEAMRAEWLSRYGYLPAQDSIEQAWIELAADLAYDLDAGGGSLWDAMSAYTAQGAALDRWFAGRPARRPATASRYTFRATATSGSVTYPAGWIVQGGGPEGSSRWRVVVSTVVTTSPTAVVFEALDTGPITMPGGTTTLQIVTPITGIASVSYNSAGGDLFTVGRDRETDAQYRARGLSVRGSAGGTTYPGLRARLLGLSWVQAVALARPSVGVARITVYPAPVGADQEAELGENIVYGLAWGIVSDPTSGNSEVVTLPDGDGTDTAYWAVGVDDPIPVAVQVVLDGVTLAQVEAGIQDAIVGVVAALNVGSPLRYAAVFVAVASVPGVVGITTLTLDGVAADYVPAPTDLVVLSATPTVTT